MITQVEIPTLNPESWNAAMTTIAKRRPLRCVRTGTTWNHPWLISPEWDADDGWVFRIKAGFVNGKEAEIGTLARLAGRRTLDRIEAVTGKRPQKREPVTARLTEAPRIPFGGMRIIGKGASPSEVITAEDGAITVKFEGVPEFFTQFGVTAESVVFTGGLNSGIQLVAADPTTTTQTPPILRALDVVLSVDRLTAKLDILRGNGMLDSFNAIYAVTYGRSVPIKEFPTVRTDAKYIGKTQADLGSFTAELGDEETDSLKIATIYLLSPPDTPAESVPDATWLPFVAHDVFWNLAHAPQNLPDPAEFEPLRLRTGLAGGFADTIFAGLLSTLNDEMSAAFALAQARNLTGRFWTL